MQDIIILTVLSAPMDSWASCIMVGSAAPDLKAPQNLFAIQCSIEKKKKKQKYYFKVNSMVCVVLSTVSLQLGRTGLIFGLQACPTCRQNVFDKWITGKEEVI